VWVKLQGGNYLGSAKGMSGKGNHHNNSQNNNNTSHNSSKRKGMNSKGAQWKSNRLPSANKENFKGECEELNGKIFILEVPSKLTTTTPHMKPLWITSSGSTHMVWTWNKHWRHLR